jgi:hypothetical protein
LSRLPEIPHQSAKAVVKGGDALYRRSAHLYIRLTDDRRKLPVQIRVRMQFAIGSITLQLEKHE